MIKRGNMAAIVEQKKGFSPVWILPVLAVCLGGWLLFKSIYEDGIDITVRVEDSSGIVANKTPVMFKGNQVGLVKDIQLRDDLLGVDLLIEMNKGAKPYLVEDMVFWVEKVNVKASRVSGLDTLFSGNYIAIQPGVSAKITHEFIAHKQRPPISKKAPGLHLILQAKQFKSLDIGSAIYTQNIEIGSVQNYLLQDDNTVLIEIYIEPQYKHLVRKGTRFWNASGITISGGIANLEIHISSLSTLLLGGINMQTPENLHDSAQAENGDIFQLYSGVESLAEFDLPVGLQITLEADDLGSITAGSGVYYRKVQVGEVTETRLSPTFQKVLLDVIIYEHYKVAVRENSKFWNASGVSVSGGVLSGLDITTESIQSMISGGIAFATPDEENMGLTVSNGHLFTLHEKIDEEWKTWSPDLEQKNK